MIPVFFLHGGGEHPQTDQRTFSEMVRAARADQDGRIALILAAESMADMETWCSTYVGDFVRAGAQPANMVSCFLMRHKPLTREMIEAVAPQGIFVCGGETPLYQEVLCADSGWTNYLYESRAVYGGTSAGAAVASTQAIVGGWRVNRSGMARQMNYQGAGENLDLLTVRNGLGLVPFSIDVHASQWGTLSRLIHAVDTGAVERGCAIDENTLIRVEGNKSSVLGVGHVYHVTRDGGGIRLKIYKDGDTFEA